MIGIITATKEEFEALNQVLKTNETGAMRYIEGTIEGMPVVGVQAGIGKVAVSMCTQKMIDLYHPEAIWMVGVAGALSKTLRVGDIVISKDAVQHDFDTHFFGDAYGWVSGFDAREFKADETQIRLAEKAAKALGINYELGRIVSGDQFISEPAKKEWLISTFDGTCTEMEGAALAQVCTVEKVPFVIIRAISDGAGGEAAMQYEQFVKLAAKNALALIKKMVEEAEK